MKLSGVKVVSNVPSEIEPGTFDAVSKVSICRAFSQ